MSRDTQSLLCCLVVASAVLVGPAGWAQTPTDLQRIEFSADIASSQPGDGAVVAGSDDTVFALDFDDGFAVAIKPIGEFSGAGVDAYHAGGAGCGNALFSLDTTTPVAGVTMRPADVFDEFGTRVLDARTLGIPAGVNVDAVSRDPDSCLLVFSVDVTTELGGDTFEPGDLVSWDPINGFGMYRPDSFGVDIDALHLLGEGRMLISVATAVSFSGGLAHDDDVFEVIPDGSGSAQLARFSPRSLDDSWIAADLDALWAVPRLQAQAGTVRWAEAGVTFLETDGAISLTVERVDGFDGSIGVEWAASDGSAVDPQDFLGGSGTLTLNDGDTGGSVVVTLIDDGLIEGSELFTVTITGATNGAAVGSPATITVEISDDEDFLFADGFEG